jgi:hypothetical protein
MLTYRMIDWVDIQQRMVAGGLSDIPNGRFVDSYRKDDYLYFIVDFNSPEDEMMFLLRWA